MGHLLLWPPLVWTVRFLLLVNAGGILYVSTLYLARFLRPSNARALVTGGLPVLRRIGGTAKVMGQELTLNANVAESKTDRLSRVEQRLDDLEVYVQKLSTTFTHLLNDTRTLGGPDA